MDSTTPQNKKWVLKSYCAGHIQPTDYELKDIDYPGPPRPGEVLVKLKCISIDAFGSKVQLLKKEKCYEHLTPSLNIGDTLNSYGVYEVIESKNSNYEVGSHLFGLAKVQLYQLFGKDTPIEKAAVGVAPYLYLSVLGLSSGITAYLSVTKLAKIKGGEVIYVSSAAGGVGLYVAQFLKTLGKVNVIGSVGSDEKVKFLKDYGYDHVFNYKKESVHEALSKLAPQGLDLYYDNVGGETLDTVLTHMKYNGHIIACGSVADYDKPPEKSYHLKNWFHVIIKGLNIQGFITSYHWPNDIEKAREEIVGLLKKGLVKSHETRVEGFDQFQFSLLLLYKGKNLGKLLLEVEPEMHLKEDFIVIN